MADLRSNRLDPRWIIAAVAVVVLVIASIALLSPGDDGSEVITRTSKQMPSELPLGLVPEGATEVRGQVASRGGEWLSVSVEFLVNQGNRDEIAQAVEQAAERAGWAFYERVYDTTTMILRWNDAEGSALTMTLRTEETTVRAGAVAVRATTT